MVAVGSDGRPGHRGQAGREGVRRREVSCATRPDAHHATPSLAFALSRLTQERHQATAIGVFRDIEAPVYDQLMAGQLDSAAKEKGEGDLEALLRAGETWNVP